MKNKKLYNIWLEYLKGQGIDQIKQCFDLIEEQYSSRNRHYHNLGHLKNLVTQIQCATLPYEDRRTLIFTAFFHDLVYKPGSKNNEEESAQLAQYWLSILRVGQKTIRKVCDIIKATSNHQSEDELTKKFIDMDLSVLGSNKYSYRKYCAAIRKEH